MLTVMPMSGAHVKEGGQKAWLGVRPCGTVTFLPIQDFTVPGQAEVYVLRFMHERLETCFMGRRTEASLESRAVWNLGGKVSSVSPTSQVHSGYSPKPVCCK